jgi:hypothetical protein
MLNEVLANNFNVKKTKNNEIMRLKNYYKKSNKIVPFQIKRENKNLLTNEEIKIQNQIFNFNNIKTSATIDVNLNNLKRNNNISSPIIHYKEINIPIFLKNDMFDLSLITNNINIPIVMNKQIDNIDNREKSVLMTNDLDISEYFFESNDLMRDNLSLLKNRIDKINHIYQEKYAFGVNTTGLGDFVRSCFYIIQFCNKYNFKYEIIINHPIALFLKNSHFLNSQNSSFDNISMFTQNNLKETIFKNNEFVLSNKSEEDFIDFLCKQIVVDNTIYCYNTLFPYDIVSEKEKNEIKLLLEPNEEMSIYLQKNYDLLNFEKNKYVIFHIRSGDKYLVNDIKGYDSLFLSTIYDDIELIIKKFQNNFFVISDNNEIKKLVCKKFPMIKTCYNEITHLGEGIKLEHNRVKNTMLDFYLIGNAEAIYSYTVYSHGTGFSYWCAKVNDIPYTCKYIK